MRGLQEIEVGICLGEGHGHEKSVYTWSAKGFRVLFIICMQETWVRSLGWEDPLEMGRLPTPVFWPGEFHGLYSLWDRRELDTIKQLSLLLGDL